MANQAFPLTCLSQLHTGKHVVVKFHMQNIEKVLHQFGSSLCKTVEVSGLFSHNATAYKWKAPWRSFLLREAIAWRLHDLLEQSHTLMKGGGILGARILLRSAFETLAILVYLNKAMRSVVDGSLNFHEFSLKTSRLLLGSRDKSTNHESINILSILRSADKRYPGIESWYAALCESAHPNYEGMLFGYSTADKRNHITTFENRWQSLYGSEQESSILACLVVFEGEYNDEWPHAMEALENWIERHDEELEASKPASEV